MVKEEVVGGGGGRSVLAVDAIDPCEGRNVFVDFVYLNFYPLQDFCSLMKSLRVVM